MRILCPTVPSITECPLLQNQYHQPRIARFDRVCKQPCEKCIAHEQTGILEDDITLQILPLVARQVWLRLLRKSQGDKISSKSALHRSRDERLGVSMMPVTRVVPRNNNHMSTTMVRTCA